MWRAPSWGRNGEEGIKGRGACERPLGALLSHGLGSSEAQRVGRRAKGGKGSWVGWGRLLLEESPFTQSPQL